MRPLGPGQLAVASKVQVVVYRFTGRQGLFKVPEGWCRECDLLIRSTERAIRSAKAEDKAELRVRPWFLWFWKPLLRNRAWHAPILTVNGRLVSQGIVPPVEDLATAIRMAGETL